MLETLLCCRTRVTCGMRIGSAPCCPSTCNPLRYFSICRLASRTNARPWGCRSLCTRRAHLCCTSLCRTEGCHTSRDSRGTCSSWRSCCCCACAGTRCACPKSRARPCTSHNFLLYNRSALGVLPR